jgi:hypothetical protein
MTTPDEIPVHVTTNDQGQTVRTTWAPTREKAKLVAKDMKHHGADRTKVFANGGIERFRIVGWWKRV